MKRLLSMISALALAALAANAQPYRLSEGVAYEPPFDKGGHGIAIVIKPWVSTHNFIDCSGCYYTDNAGFEFAGAYMWNLPVPILNGLNAHVGPGAHFSIVTDGSGFYGELKHVEYGIIADVGLEYVIPKTHLSLAFDYRPHFTRATKDGGRQFLDLRRIRIGINLCF
ncbi:MAG: hypothetical protein MJZ17_01180 [Bacteroidales bacterium]|nr:hypothetical protein [Bacteroidales bacterium]